jgi:hypothetical protein
METMGNAIKNKKKLLVNFTNVKEHLKESINILNSDFDVRLYHYPLCVLPQELWNYSWRSLEERKITFLETCNACLYKKYCLGIMRTYLVNFGNEEFIPILKKIKLTETNDMYHPISSVSRG